MFIYVNVTIIDAQVMMSSKVRITMCIWPLWCELPSWITIYGWTLFLWLKQTKYVWVSALPLSLTRYLLITWFRLTRFVCGLSVMPCKGMSTRCIRPPCFYLVPYPHGIPWILCLLNLNSPQVIVMEGGTFPLICMFRSGEYSTKHSDFTISLTISMSVEVFLIHNVDPDVSSLYSSYIFAWLLQPLHSPAPPLYWLHPVWYACIL